jgi:succinyl-CoA synthetase alpha subunit
MATLEKIITNQYRDSVSLMQISATLSALPGVQQASMVMATENNIDLLREAGLLERGVDAGPNDLLIVLQGDDDRALGSALDAAVAEIEHESVVFDEEAGARFVPRSIEMALADKPDMNLALISTPGEYAAAEALKALHHGLHVMLFSDNVRLEDEIMLKQYARDHGLLVMGPDCGTAIINGIPLAFANVVQRGDIGLVAASGTGLQQVSSLIDRLGGGVSQAIGVGSHDLHVQVGGISMLAGIAALAADPDTKVIALISKPPAPQVAERVLEKAAQAGKPVVVDFIGADLDARDNIFAVRTLEDAAAMAVALSRGQVPSRPLGAADEKVETLADQVALEFAPSQKYVRGLFTGGTFCFETLLLLQESLGPVYSNIPLRPEYRLPDVWKSQQHTAIDMGDDLFTQGRPHPMIDFRLRNQRILHEAADPEVAVILLDVVLGFGSHMDPASELVPTITRARTLAAEQGRDLAFVGSVCGTRGDPQGLTRQEAALRQAGMLLKDSNASAARLAAALINQYR